MISLNSQNIVTLATICVVGWFAYVQSTNQNDILIKQNIAELKSAVVGNTDLLKRLDASSRDATEQYVRMQEQIKVLNAQVSKLSEDRLTEGDISSIFERKLQNYTNRLTVVESKQNQYLERFGSLNQQLVLLERKTDDLQLKLSECKDSIIGLSSRMRDVETNINSVKSEIESMRDDVDSIERSSYKSGNYLQNSQRD